MSRKTGAPTWIDLSAKDPDAAQAFYTEVFGWSFVDQGEEFGGYRMISSGDVPVGGLMRSVDAQGNPVDRPSQWTVYLSTPDMEKTQAAVTEAGGTVILPPMRVPESGYMGLVQAPSGAHLGLWQPVEFDGFETPLTPGTPVWFEAMTTDFDTDLPFYRDALGWDIAWMGPEGGGDGFRYVTDGEGDAAVAGLCDAKNFIGGAPSYWRFYLDVENTDAAIEKIKAAGGSLLDGPEDSPFGRVATVADPEGASFQINQAPQR